MQRPLLERAALRPTKRQLVDLTAELLRTRVDRDDLRAMLALSKKQRAALSDELMRARADGALKDQVIAKLRAQLIDRDESKDRPPG